MAVLIIIFGILAILICVALKGNKFQTNEDTYVITTPIKSSSQSSDKIKIDINSFITKYRSVIDESLFIQLQKKTLFGEKYTYLDKLVVRHLDCKLIERKNQDAKLKNTAYNNNKGIELEKLGRIEDAISVYENNISGDCYPACHSFDRLMILYRKQKRYDDEIRVIEKAIEILSPRYPDLKPKYEQRLQKVNILRNNNNIDN